ncbi:MAG TPA: diguanylate cyclase [Solirubrobacteraceae bacterium]|nr:diguanylate cyclase [Solirubrobacteraceae bacterium]
MSLLSNPEPPGDVASGKHFSCSMSAVLLARVHEQCGEEGVSELLRLAQSRRSPAYLSDIANWISFDEGVALWRAGARVTHHPQFARAVGEDAARRLNGSPVANLLRSLGSPEAVYAQIATVATKYSTAVTLEAVSAEPGCVEIVGTPAEGMQRDADHCAWTCGLLSQPTVLFGLPPATVHHERCAALGAPACEYRITWSGGTVASGPGAEDDTAAHQLEAMKLRLASMFQTAADLIGSGDVDEVLARIADRAAVEVRAPGHLLAVRMTPSGPLHCHHTGLDPADVPACAERLLGSEASDLPSEWLVVPVRSNRHDYGRLLAMFDAGARFFPQERELLEVYARYAATALDSATALQEAERRFAQSSALLDLARALAAAGTSTEIARRLADAVPLVVDCDRVGVYLWDPGREELSRQAVATVAGVQDAPVCAPPIWRPRPDGPVGRLVRSPNSDPIFLDDASGDPVIHRLYREEGFIATILVPLATPGQFMGLLSVSVRDRPERLAASADLLDRLSGVTAQATTALQNGRLVDLITHQATHDQLTGLANRRQFTAEVRTAVARARDTAESGALLYVDLDRFKPVNDELGHEAGDELLVAVAERLRGCTRAGDVVARLGGDEFAVLLAAAEPGDVERVSERIVAGFREPFAVTGHRLRLGASIGRSVYPLDADDADALLRRADAAMFAQKRVHHAQRIVLGAPQAAV